MLNSLPPMRVFRGLPAKLCPAGFGRNLRPSPPDLILIRSGTCRVRDAVYHQSMVLVVVGILQKKPIHRAQRVVTGEWLPCSKVPEMLLMHVSSECERVCEPPRSDVRGQTDIP